MTQILKDFIATAGTPFPPDHMGDGYRCSVRLEDGTELPCVMLRRPEPIIELAQRRIAEEGRGKGVFSKHKDPSREMLAHFLTKGNRVNGHNIKSVFSSKYAIPLDILKEIDGETLMAWTGFVFEMSDGNMFSYGSTFLFQFFDLPDGYTFDQVAKVHNHSYVDESGNIREIKADVEAWRASLDRLRVYREKPFFDCFVAS